MMNLNLSNTSKLEGYDFGSAEVELLLDYYPTNHFNALVNLKKMTWLMMKRWDGSPSMELLDSALNCCVHFVGALTIFFWNCSSEFLNTLMEVLSNFLRSTLGRANSISSSSSNITNASPTNWFTPLWTKWTFEIDRPEIIKMFL